MPGGDAAQIYHDLMRFKPDGLTPNGWAMKAGVSRTVWSDMRRHGNPSRRTLEKLLTAAGSSLAEFEALRVSEHSKGSAGAGGLADRRASSWGGAQLPPVSLIATALAGEWGERRIALLELRPADIIERLSRPASLAQDASAYAITIVGDSMWPRFRPGRRVAVSANAPAAIGDDVLVRLHGSTSGECIHALTGELLRRTGTGVELRQFNPDETFHVTTEDIQAIEKVVGELI